MKKFIAFILLVSIIVPILPVTAARAATVTMPSAFTLTSQKDYAIATGVSETVIDSTKKQTSTSSGNKRPGPGGMPGGTTSSTSPVNSYFVTVDMSKNVDIMVNYGEFYKSSLTNTKVTWKMVKATTQAGYYAKTSGENVVATMNGDFYNVNTGEPNGALVMNGVTYHDANSKPYFAILNDGTAVIKDAGSKITANVREAVGGGTILVKNGAVVSALSVETKNNPGTCIGIKADGTVIIHAVDGRDNQESVGMTIYEQAQMMECLGCKSAMLLDGGGSTTFATKRKDETAISVKNDPSQGSERSISSSIMVIAGKVRPIITPTPTPKPKATATPTPKPKATPTATPKKTATPKPAVKKTATPKPAVKKTATPSPAVKRATTAPNIVKTVQNAFAAKKATPSPVPKTAVKGKRFYVDGIIYSITSMKSKTVAMVGTINKSAREIKIPAKVTFEGKKYRVTRVLKEACISNVDLTKLILGKNVKKIGKRAFYGCKKLKIVKGLKYIGIKDYATFKRQYILK